MNKFFFPNLKSAIIAKGMTQEEFKQKARHIDDKPSYRGWSLLMNEKNGMTEVYANKAKNTLSQLGFSEEDTEKKMVQTAIVSK